MTRRHGFAFALAAMVAAIGCNSPGGTTSRGSTTSPAATAPSAATASAAPVGATSAPASAAAVAEHDPANPPIDCPLRKAGIKPHDMKPFEDVEKYIAFLERADRVQWQKPDAVVTALELSGSETIADLGAGSGYFSFRFAKALPQGQVVAIDIEPEMIRHIHHKAMTTNVSNIEVKLAQPDDPSVPAAADWVFICDVLHHVKDRPAWLGKLHGQMKPEAKVALSEFKTGKLPEGPPESLKISREAMVDLMKTAGFALEGENKELLPYQHMLVFGKG